MEEKTANLEAQPGHKLAVPLFLLTSLPYFLAIGYDIFIRDTFDDTFLWFGGFYVILSATYVIVRLAKKRSQNNTP